MLTTGLLSFSAPVDPANGAFPNAKIPPSDATSQYPLAVGGGSHADDRLVELHRPVDPWNCSVAEAEDSAVCRHEPIAATVWGRGHTDHRLIELHRSRRSVELSVAVSEDPSVCGHEPVATTVGGASHPDDGLVQVQPRGRAVGPDAAEGGDAASGRVDPVAGNRDWRCGRFGRVVGGLLRRCGECRSRHGCECYEEDRRCEHEAPWRQRTGTPPLTSGLDGRFNGLLRHGLLCSPDEEAYEQRGSGPESTMAEERREVPLWRSCLLSARTRAGSTSNPVSYRGYVPPWGHGPVQWESPRAASQVLQASQTSAPQELCQAKCQVDRLPSVQAGITGCGVAVPELCLCDIPFTSEAFGDIVACELDVNSARPGPHFPVSLEEPLQLAEDVVEAPRLVASVGDEGVRVHRVADPDHRVGRPAHGFEDRGQHRRHLRGAHAGDESEPTRRAVWIESFAERDYVLWRCSRPDLGPRSGCRYAGRELDVGTLSWRVRSPTQTM